MRAWVLGLAAWAATAVGALAQTQTPQPDPAALRQGYARLALDFCAPLVLGEQTIEQVAAAQQGLSVGRTLPLAALDERMRQILRGVLDARDDTPIAMIGLPQTSVDAFVVAFARADREGCVVLAQDIPEINVEARRRLDLPESPWAFDSETPAHVRTYTLGQGRDARGAALYIGPQQQGQVDRILVRRIDGLLPRETAQARRAWAELVLTQCLASVFEDRELSPAAFPGWTADGGPTQSGAQRLVGGEGAPLGVLMINAIEHRGCIFLGAVGQVAEWRDAVAAGIRARRGVETQTPASIRAPKFNIPNPAGGAAALTVVDTGSGSLMVIVRTEMREAR
ncbi:MAG: hypothetical protein AB7J28_08550 [Hyphomonadaceae bacterium]